MAFEMFTCRLPTEYCEYIASLAKALKQSEGFIVQQMVYGSSNGRLSLPKHRATWEEEDLIDLKLKGKHERR